jgi:hypothetical protein
MGPIGIPEILAAVGMALSVLLYVLPTIIAVRRKKTDLRRILLVNVLLGWTVIGWAVALVWAVR